MIGGPLVELVVVLFFVFLTMSAIVSTVQELLAQILRVRSHTLKHCIRKMLEDETYGDRIYRRFFRNPRIAVAGRSVNQLTNIEPEDFAVAVATAIQPEDSTDDCIGELPASIEALRDGELKRRLRLALPDALRPNATADQIRASLMAWFNASMNKAMEQYRSDTQMRLHMVAAALTVLFNVSPIEIAQRLSSDTALRTAFASVAPELSTLVLNVNQNTNALLTHQERPQQVSLNGPGPAPQSSPQSIPQSGLGGNVTTVANPLGEESGVIGGGGVAGASNLVGVAAAGLAPLSDGDAQTMFAIFNCTRNRISLPIGWPWMGEWFGKLEDRASSMFASAADQPEVCARTLAAAQKASPNLKQRLAMLNASGSDMKASAETFEPRYGPNFYNDEWYMVLLGWIITTIAAAQGAPFWFQLLRRVINR